MEEPKRSHLLALPLELFRMVLDLSSQHDLHGVEHLLRLRLVNREFSQEVLVACQRTSMHYEWERAHRAGKEVSWFLAAYLLARPPAGEPPSLPSLLHDGLDTVQRVAGINPTNRAERCQQLRRVARYLLSLQHKAFVRRSWERYPFRAWEPALVAASPELTAACLLAIENHPASLQSFLDSQPIELLQQEHPLFGSLLFSAVSTSLYGIVSALLDRGFSSDRLNRDVFESVVFGALERAAHDDNVRMVELILEPKRGYRPTDSDFDSLVMTALRHFGAAASLRLLHAAEGLDLPQVCRDGLRAACLIGNPALVRRILTFDTGIDPNVDRSWESDEARWSPLDTAAWAGHEEVVRILLASGADVYGGGRHRTIPPDGIPEPSAMSRAARLGHVGVANVLMDAGFQTNAWGLSQIIQSLTKGVTESGKPNLAFFRVLVDRQVHGEKPPLKAELDPRLFGAEPQRSERMRMICKSGRVDTLLFAASLGVPLTKDFYADSGLTLVQEAIASRQDLMVAVLVELGASPEEEQEAAVEPRRWQCRALSEGSSELDPEHSEVLFHAFFEQRRKGLPDPPMNFDSWAVAFLKSLNSTTTKTT